MDTHIKQLLAKQTLIHFRFNDPEDDHQRAINGFAALGANGKAALDVLLPDLLKPSLQVRALIVIGAIGAEPKAALPIIRQMWTTNQSPIILTTLVLIGLGDPSTVQFLQTEFSKPYSRRILELSLEQLKPGPEAAVTNLIAHLNSNDPVSRAFPLLALKSMGPSAKAAAAELTPLLASRPADRVQIAATVLTSAPDDLDARKKAVAALIDAVGDERETNRLVALQFLHRCGTASRTALSALRKALDHGDRSIRYEALQSVRDLDPEPHTAVPVLAAALKDSDPEIRLEALNGLARFHQASAPALTAIADCLNDSKWRVRFAAMRALASLSDSATSAIPALSSFLKDSNTMVRAAAETAIDDIESGGTDPRDKR